MLSNILLTPFDQEMRRRGYQLTRFADDWVVTCRSAAEARAAIAVALRILSELGVQLNPQKTRVVHVRHGFEFLGYLIRRGRQLRLPSIQRFKDRVRQLTRRGVPLKTPDLIEQLNPVLRGWGHYYKRAHVRTLFNKLDHWIERRIWSHRYKCWRNCGWKQLPKAKLYGEYGLVHLVKLIPSIASQPRASS